MDTPVVNTSSNSGKLAPGPATPWLGLPMVREIARDGLGAGVKLRQQYGDAVHFRMVGQAYYYFFSPELIRQVLVERADDFIRHERAIEVFSQVYGDNVLTAEGDIWKRQRRILMPGFLPKRLTGYVGLMIDATADALRTILPGASGESGSIDVDSFTTRLTMDVILRVLFTDKASEEESRRAVEATRTLEHQSMRELFWPKTPPDWFPYPGRKQKLQARDTLVNLIRSRIQARRNAAEDHAGKTDYLAMLLSAHDEEAQGAAATLSSDEIADNCMVIFAAGHDTTATVMTWWIGLMARHPEIADKARQEVAELIGERDPTVEELGRLKWVNASIKEAMRLYPPTPSLFFRRAVRDVEIGGWHVPKGASVNIPVWQVHHDERWFADPEQFRPERFMANAPDIPRGAYLPFGAGPRVCIGQHLATIEMALIAAFLLRHFDFSFEEGQALWPAEDRDGPEAGKAPAGQIHPALKPQSSSLSIRNVPAASPTASAPNTISMERPDRRFS